MAAARKKAPPKKAGTKRRRGVTVRPAELEPSRLGAEPPPQEVSALGRAVEQDGGAVLATYREPLGGHFVSLVSLPVDKVSPTPFQRDVSDAHVRKLTRAMDKTQRYLDPIVVVRQDGQYLTPNGNHRLTVMRELGASAIVALLVPEKEVAYQILALNIEKAHNLRERGLEVARMYRDLAGFSTEKEKSFELELEEPALVTLGFAYQKRGRLAGGAYHPALSKVDGWIDRPLPKALELREKRADQLLELDDAVNAAVTKLKERGLTSPYLKSFVVARINPLRFIKGDLPSFDQLLATMTRRASGMKVDKIKSEDLARSGGFSEEDASAL
jgi:ParB family transcriptional regulator, chromosome partitioning protein